MLSQNLSRRLAAQSLNQDIDSLNGFNVIQGYSTQRSEATPAALQQTYQAMLALQQAESDETLTSFCDGTSSCSLLNCREGVKAHQPQRMT